MGLVSLGCGATGLYPISRCGILEGGASGLSNQQVWCVVGEASGLSNQMVWLLGAEPPILLKSGKFQVKDCKQPVGLTE